MPLVKDVIKSGVTADLTPIIQSKSKKAFKDAMIKFKDVVAAGGNVDSFANASEQASVVFSTVMMELAEEIGKSVATHVDTYIKAADVQVTIMPGMVTQGASTASAPNPAPIPVKGSPTGPALGGIS